MTSSCVFEELHVLASIHHEQLRSNPDFHINKQRSFIDLSIFTKKRIERWFSNFLSTLLHSMPSNRQKRSLSRLTDHSNGWMVQDSGSTERYTDFGLNVKLTIRTVHRPDLGDSCSSQGNKQERRLLQFNTLSRYLERMTNKQTTKCQTKGRPGQNAGRTVRLFERTAQPIGHVSRSTRPADRLASSQPIEQPTRSNLLADRLPLSSFGAYKQGCHCHTFHFWKALTDQLVLLSFSQISSDSDKFSS